MDKLEKRIREVQDEVAQEFLDDHLAEHKQKGRDRALLLAGGFRTALKIATAINSEVMRSLEIFQEERLYLDLGFERFVDFLDQCEHSPMSKAQYYERRAILDKEGDQVFDLLSDLGVSIRRRKLLGKGNVEIEGEMVIIHDGEEEISIELKDRSRILETLSALADANADKSAKLDRQKEKIDQHDEKVRELYAEIDVEKARQKSEFASDPHMIARLEMNLALGKLAQVAEDLPDIEKDQFRDAVLEELAAHRNALAHAYLTTARKPAADLPKNDPNMSDEEYLASLIESVDLDDNEAELASQI